MPAPGWGEGKDWIRAFMFSMAAALGEALLGSTTIQNKQHQRPLAGLPIFAESIGLFVSAGRSRPGGTDTNRRIESVTRKNRILDKPVSSVSSRTSGQEAGDPYLWHPYAKCSCLWPPLLGVSLRKWHKFPMCVNSPTSVCEYRPSRRAGAVQSLVGLPGCGNDPSPLHCQQKADCPAPAEQTWGLSWAQVCLPPVHMLRP